MNIFKTGITAILLLSAIMLFSACGSDKKATLRVDMTDVQAGSILSLEITDYDTGEQLDVQSIENPGSTNQSHTFEVPTHDMPAVVEISNILGDKIIQYGKAVTNIDGLPIILEDGKTIVVTMELVVPTVER